MIELQSISRCFGDKPVIQELSHSFPDTGIFALMGPSGCGKTTLLRLLAGLDQPNSGSIRSTHTKIAMAFQEPRLLPWMNCEDNLKLVLPKNNEEPEITQKWLTALELADVAKALPNALSGGMKQRLSLARALAFGGDLLLMDEPFSALDQALKDRIAPQIREVGKSRLTIIVTHDLTDAERLGASILHCSGIPLHALAEQ